MSNIRVINQSAARQAGLWLRVVFYEDLETGKFEVVSRQTVEPTHNTEQIQIEGEIPESKFSTYNEREASIVFEMISNQLSMINSYMIPLQSIVDYAKKQVLFLQWKLDGQPELSKEEADWENGLNDGSFKDLLLGLYDIKKQSKKKTRISTNVGVDRAKVAAKMRKKISTKDTF